MDPTATQYPIVVAHVSRVGTGGTLAVDLEHGEYRVSIMIPASVNVDPIDRAVVTRSRFLDIVNGMRLGRQPTVESLAASNPHQGTPWE